MKIYIDESGTFKKAEDKDFSISCVGTLVIPDWSYPKLIKKYIQIRTTLPKDKNGEIKGKSLNEKQVNSVIEVLIRNNALFEAIAIDMNLQDETALKEQRIVLRENHVNRMSSEGLKKNGEWLRNLQNSMDSMSQQLLVQFLLTTRLLHRTIPCATAYYSQRVPQELKKFEWHIDAKSIEGMTNAENWWQQTVSPFLASLSKSEPAMILPYSDYSYYDATFSATDGEEEGHDLKKVFSDMKFESNIDFGLELADILTNTVRRALVGNLQESGWQKLPELMIMRNNTESIQLMLFSENNSSQIRSAPYAKIYRKIGFGRKNMISSRIRKLMDEKLKNEDTM